MSKTYISLALRRLVTERANNQCEYCHLLANLSFFPHELDPRTQSWSEHFSPNQHRIEGLTPEGHTTAKLLQLNTPERIAERERLIS